MKNLTLRAATDVGMVREKNEDSFWIKDFGDTAVIMVADGMGGAVGGKIASTTAVETAEEIFRSWSGEQPVADVIINIMRLAHQRIREKGATVSGNLNMGTTCTVAVIGDRGQGKKVSGAVPVWFGHIGDSKLYHIRAGMVVQRSTDHSMLQRMLDAGALTPEEAKNYAHKNIIYKSLGGSENADVDPAQEFKLEPGDALLLCSDGLSNYVTTDEMMQSLAGAPSLEKAAAYMVNLAKASGGDDNITVVIAELGAYPRDKRIKLAPIKVAPAHARARSKTPAVIGLLIILGVLCSLLAFVLREEKQGHNGTSHPKTKSQTPPAIRSRPPESSPQQPSQSTDDQTMEKKQENK